MGRGRRVSHPWELVILMPTCNASNCPAGAPFDVYLHGADFHFCGHHLWTLGLWGAAEQQKVAEHADLVAG